MSNTERDKEALKRANIRLALALGVIVLVLIGVTILSWPGVDIPT